MKHFFYFLMIGLLFWNCQSNEKNQIISDISTDYSAESKIQEGDIIFQTSQSNQSLAIQKQLNPSIPTWESF